jgi:hypothetical protein
VRNFAGGFVGEGNIEAVDRIRGGVVNGVGNGRIFLRYRERQASVDRRSEFQQAARGGYRCAIGEFGFIDRACEVVGLFGCGRRREGEFVGVQVASRMSGARFEERAIRRDCETATREGNAAVAVLVFESEEDGAGAKGGIEEWRNAYYCFWSLTDWPPASARS